MKKTISQLLYFIFAIAMGGDAYANQIKAEELFIDSAVLGEQRKLVVYLPDDYQNNEEKFPVLYITDGDIQGPHTAGTLDYLAKFDQTPKMIVVGIVNPRETRQRDLTVSVAKEQDPQKLENADRFLTFIEKEVIPTVKEGYRTLDYQALSGTSHGGQFAVNAMIKKPHLFDGIIAISPSLYWNNNQLLALAEEALKKQQLQGRLFVSIANEEPTMTDPFEKFVSMTTNFTTEKLTVGNKTFNDETHNTTVLQGQYYGLKHLFKGWAIPESPQTLADLQRIFKRRSQLLNVTAIIPEDRAAGYGQWLQYLNRKDDAIALLDWNRQNYPRSFNAHTSLIRAYLHFKMPEEAAAARKAVLETFENLTAEQKGELERLFT